MAGVLVQRFTRASPATTLDATGGAQVEIGVTGGDWVVTRSTVKVTTNTKEPTFRLYRSRVSDAGYLEGTYTGSDDVSDTRHVFQQGESIVGVWSGGDVGAKATLSLNVIQYPPGMAPPE